MADRLKFGESMKIIIILLSVTFIACTLDKKEKLTNDIGEPKSPEVKIEWSIIEVNGFHFKVPSAWKAVGYADTIPGYFAFKLYEENDSAFFQLSKDSAQTRIDSYLKGEFEMMDSWNTVNTSKYCIEKIQLKNNKAVWYAKLDFDVSGIDKVGHFFILPHKANLYQLRLSMPANWDDEWARYLMSQIAFSIEVEGERIFMESNEIKEIQKDCN